MSMNVYQNQEYAKQGNFGAGNFPTPEAPAQVDMLKSMNLPTTPDEFVKFAPFALGAIGFSKLVSNIATTIGRVNPFKNPNANLAESFEKSPIANISRKIDNALLPIANKYARQINTAKSAFSKLTPSWVKNLAEKIKIGVDPKCTLAVSQYRGLTNNSAEYFLGLLKDVPADKMTKLGIGDIVSLFTSKTIKATDAVEQIAKRLAKVPAKELQSLKIPVKKGLFSFLSGKNLRFVDELNKSRSFIAANAKTPVTKLMQKGIMSVSEAAGGGVIGGALGIIMNSIFLASTLKRTWNAPWGEKLSTFMEGALVDFCGGYLMMLLGSRITYKLLGIKNADKSVAQLKNIKDLTAKVVADKNNYNMLQKMLKSGVVDPSVIQTLGINPAKISSSSDLLKAIKAKVPNAGAINSSIDKLSKMKGFQSQGFLKDLINRPLRWIGNFFSVGLDSLPSKLADGKNISAFKAGLMKCKNFLKGFAGFPMRFFLITLIVTPPLTKLCAKISHTLFGKPTNSIYEDKITDKKQSKNLNTPSINMQNFTDYTKMTGLAHAQNQPQVPQTIQPQISPNLINQTIINQQQRLSAPTPQTNAAISPATYIPDTTPIKFTDPAITAALNQKLDFSNKVEKQINRELKSLRTGDAFDF